MLIRCGENKGTRKILCVVYPVTTKSDLQIEQSLT